MIPQRGRGRRDDRRRRSAAGRRRPPRRSSAKTYSPGGSTGTAGGGQGTNMATTLETGNARPPHRPARGEGRNTRPLPHGGRDLTRHKSLPDNEILIPTEKRHAVCRSRRSRSRSSGASRCQPPDAPVVSPASPVVPLASRQCGSGNAAANPRDRTGETPAPPARVAQRREPRPSGSARDASHESTPPRSLTVAAPAVLCPGHPRTGPPGGTSHLRPPGHAAFRARPAATTSTLTGTVVRPHARRGVAVEHDPLVADQHVVQRDAQRPAEAHAQPRGSGKSAAVPRPSRAFASFASSVRRRKCGDAHRHVQVAGHQRRRVQLLDVTGQFAQVLVAVPPSLRADRCRRVRGDDRRRFGRILTSRRATMLGDHLSPKLSNRTSSSGRRLSSSVPRTAQCAGVSTIS